MRGEDTALQAILPELIAFGRMGVVGWGWWELALMIPIIRLTLHRLALSLVLQSLSVGAKTLAGTMEMASCDGGENTSETWKCYFFIITKIGVF